MSQTSAPQPRGRAFRQSVWGGILTEPFRFGAAYLTEPSTRAFGVVFQETTQQVPPSCAWRCASPPRNEPRPRPARARARSPRPAFEPPTGTASDAPLPALAHTAPCLLRRRPPSLRVGGDDLHHGGGRRRSTDGGDRVRTRCWQGWSGWEGVGGDAGREGRAWARRRAAPERGGSQRGSRVAYWLAPSRARDELGRSLSKQREGSPPSRANVHVMCSVVPSGRHRLHCMCVERPCLGGVGGRVESQG
jgi:hypothetical protein